ncbi:hypothetical protein IHE44_0011580 [Lamprotornis superbus]|uniref:Uncharacterized protein n=1 Tax=Lamprotornis superbus TaxID=245042 RepID=A0A835NHT1_9PASS|nr:hypothetical protein IHE44_0011580 [Lamprotornis superbus]
MDADIPTFAKSFRKTVMPDEDPSCVTQGVGDRGRPEKGRWDRGLGLALARGEKGGRAVLRSSIFPAIPAPRATFPAIEQRSAAFPLHPATSGPSAEHHDRHREGGVAAPSLSPLGPAITQPPSAARGLPCPQHRELSTGRGSLWPKGTGTELYCSALTDFLNEDFDSKRQKLKWGMDRRSTHKHVKAHALHRQYLTTQLLCKYFAHSRHTFILSFFGSVVKTDVNDWKAVEGNYPTPAKEPLLNRSSMKEVVHINDRGKKASQSDLSEVAFLPESNHYRPGPHPQGQKSRRKRSDFTKTLQNKLN